MICGFLKEILSGCACAGSASWMMLLKLLLQGLNLKGLLGFMCFCPTGFLCMLLVFLTVLSCCMLLLFVVFVQPAVYFFSKEPVLKNIFN